MRRHTFGAKLVGAAALVAAADWLLYDDALPGAVLGAFALGWAAVLCAVRPDLRRSAAARCALVAAAAFGVALVDDPGPLAWVLFWSALASATLLPTHRFDDALAWASRLLAHGVVGLATPFRDAVRLAAARRRRGRTSLAALASVLAVPVLGGAVFAALFASANPLIGRAFEAVRLPDLSTLVGHLVFCCVVIPLVWPSLRPRGTVPRLGAVPSAAVPVARDLPLATLTLSLVTFNAIFAVENALDLAFLWSGAALPDGVTLADYAHRGAYPLVATALLAGAFVLLASRPGSAGAGNRTVRRLIVLWVAQNVLLVASSIRRTLDYVATYSLTELRIAALAWMALVAAGLLLIVWRVLAGRSVRWLLNANALAAGVVLAGATAVDLGAVAAAWNVRHARAAADLDLCYLRELGPSALLPLIELERRAGGPRLRDRATFLRAEALDTLAAEQRDWHRWTWRGARRLAAARERLGPRPAAPNPAPHGRGCDGAALPPPPPPPTAQDSPAPPAELPPPPAVVPAPLTGRPPA